MVDNRKTERASQIVICKGGNVYVKLCEPALKARRYIGRIEERTFYTMRDFQRHLFRALNAYGFNYDFIRRGGFESVIVHTPAGDLQTTRQTILDYGEFLCFKSHGFERQIFLRIDDFGRAPRLALQPAVTNTAQLSLFGNAS